MPATLPLLRSYLHRQSKKFQLACGISDGESVSAKNITMDATGRIMPCTRPPGIDNLVFADNFQEDCFNSELHQLARQFFQNQAVYSAEVADKPPAEVPFCSRCPHANAVLDIDTRQVRQHMDNVGLYKGLSEEAKAALTDW